jgi:cytochrome P450
MAFSSVAETRELTRTFGRMIGLGALRDLRRVPARHAEPGVARTTFDPTTPAAIADPYPALSRLREHPVHVNEKLNVWMLARYADVTAAARAHDVLSSDSGILLRSAPMPTVVTTDGADHDRLRRVMAPSFAPSAIRQLKASLDEFVTPGVDALARGAVVDAVPALTVPLPVSAIAVMLGVDKSRWQDFRVWSQDVTTLFSVRSPTDLAVTTGRALPGILALRGLIVSEIRRRRGTDTDDILGRLSRSVTRGEMTLLEAVSAALLLLVAGNETTTNLLGTLLVVLAKDPNLYARLQDQRELIPVAIEEALRWGSPAQWVARSTLAPYPVGDTVIPARSRVVLFYAGANRDPHRFADPDRFDIDRTSLGHTGFGHGAHFCMGAHLARLEVTVALNQLFDRVAHLELAGPVRWTTTPSLSGPTSVPLRGTPLHR